MSNSLGWTILDAYFKEQRYPRSVSPSIVPITVKFDLPKLIAKLNLYLWSSSRLAKNSNFFVEKMVAIRVVVTAHKDDNNESVGMLPNNARI
jgi:hypothetical protein